MPLDHPAVETLAECLRGSGATLTEGFGAATDLAWYAERSIPGLICGPGALEQCHVADEYIETRQLVDAAKAYALLLERWCG